MKWNVLKSLNQLYLLGSVKKTEVIKQDSYIQYLLRSTQDIGQNPSHLFKNNSFDDMYQHYHLDDFIKYESFLIEENLLKPQTRFEEDDIKALIGLRELMTSNELEELRNQLIEAKESLRGFSLMFFRNEKYLEAHPSLIDAVKKIIDIREFPNNKDFQYLYILHCNSPQSIVLCENLNFLKIPQRARDHNIELWYAGGKNIEKLTYSTNHTKGLPIYYSCDWDYDGLKIYELVKAKIPAIILLTPNGTPKAIKDTEHRSLWKPSDIFSGLKIELYSADQISLIKQLILNNEWIIEESNDLIEMVNNTIF